MKKKISLLMIIVILVSTLFVGCTNDNGKIEEDTTKDVQVKEEVQPTEEQTSESNKDNPVAYVNTLEGIKEKGKIVMGTEFSHFPPYIFRAMVDGVDTLTGFEIVLGEYIAQDLGVELELKDMEFANLLAGIDTGMLDVAIAAMLATPERQESVDFTIPYDLSSTHHIVIRKADGDKYLTEADFNGKVVGAQTGSVQAKLAGEMEGVKLREIELMATLVLELKTEKIAGLVMPKDVALSYIETNDDLMMVEDIALSDSTDGIAIAVKKGNDDLVEYLNGVLEELLEEGLIEEWKEEANLLSNQLND